mmetsp:Transcript_30281/g.84481  ORF Transcript_30281/g.84481 Transcript_30281/m.84481 type:complete len:406 (-) Transcript_30281:86-1303(-)
MGSGPVRRSASLCSQGRRKRGGGEGRAPRVAARTARAAWLTAWSASAPRVACLAQALVGRRGGHAAHAPLHKAARARMCVASRCHRDGSATEVPVPGRRRGERALPHSRPPRCSAVEDLLQELAPLLCPAGDVLAGRSDLRGLCAMRRHHVRPQIRMVCEHVEGLATLLQDVLCVLVALHRRCDEARRAALHDPPTVRLSHGQVQQHGASARLELRDVQVRAHQLAHELGGPRVARAVHRLVLEGEVPQGVHAWAKQRAIRVLEAPQHPDHRLDATHLDDVRAVPVVRESQALDGLAHLRAHLQGLRVLLEQCHQRLDLIAVMLRDRRGEGARAIWVACRGCVEDGGVPRLVELAVQSHNWLLLLEALVLLDELVDKSHDLAVAATPDEVRQVELLAAVALRRRR